MGHINRTFRDLLPDGRGTELSASSHLPFLSHALLSRSTMPGAYISKARVRTRTGCLECQYQTDPFETLHTDLRP